MPLRASPPVQTTAQPERRNLRRPSSTRVGSTRQLRTGGSDEDVRLSSEEESQSSYAPSRAGTPPAIDKHTKSTSNPLSDADGPLTGQPTSPSAAPPSLSAAPSPHDPDTGDEPMEGPDSGEEEREGPTTDDEEIDDEDTDDEDLYAEAGGILSPAAFYRLYQPYISAAYWKQIESHRCSYDEAEEDRSKWSSALEKHSHSNANEVDLLPVLDPAHEKLRKDRKSFSMGQRFFLAETAILPVSEWGDKYKRILAVEKKRFLALPNVIKLCAGRVNSARSKGDYHMRRFWAIYMPVNCSITDRDKLQEANAKLIEFTLLRFNHLALKTNDAKVSRLWMQVRELIFS